MNGKLYDRVVLIVLSSLLTASSLLLIFSNPAGYSYNLYSQIPSKFWIVAIVSLILILARLFIYHMNYNQVERKVIWYILIMLMFYVQILIIPYALEYILINRTDEMYIPGEIKNIFETSHFYQEYDKYPLVSILYSSLFIITKLSYIKYIILIPVIFSVLYVFSLWSIFRNAYTRNQDHLIFGVLLSFIYYVSFYHVSAHPAFYSFTLSVLLIYLILSDRFLKSSSGKLLVATILISLPFSHPYYVTTSLMFLGSLVVYEVVVKKISKVHFKTYLNYITLTLILFLMWIFYNPAASYEFSGIMNAIKNAYVEPATTEGLSKVSKLTEYEIGIFIFGYLGRFSILAILITLLILSLIKREDFRHITSSNIKTWYVVLVLTTIQLILMFVPMFSHYPERHLNINYFSVAFPLGILLLASYSPNQRKLKKMIIFLFISIALIMSVFSIYMYPGISFRPNSGITSNEIISTGFIFTHKAKDIVIFSPYDQIAKRYCEFINLSTYHNCRYKNIKYLYQKVFPDKHFGYTEFGRFTILVPISNAYILLSDYALQTYFNIPPYQRTQRLSKADYFRMNSDRSLDKIYSGLNIRIYLYQKRNT